jgi:methyltransferase (TIGR00027 family)
MPDAWTPSQSSAALGHVSDTALWVAVYRAEESRRPDALFHDPYAERLAGERGFRLVDEMPKGRSWSWPMVARTVQFDRLILEHVGRDVDLVVNLAAGLDARPYRMALPPDLHWIEADLPGMIEYKESLLADERPVCRLERWALDLADGSARRELLARIAALGERVLVLTEGLLIYLDREEVTGLARDLAAVGSCRWWITDLASPGLLKMMAKTWGRQVANAGAPFRFGPPEGPEFFTPLGWRPVSAESTFHVAAAIRRLPPLLRLFAYLPQPRRWNPKRVWSGICLLERS